MARYAFLYISDTAEQEPSADAERVYGEIFAWFEANRARFVDGGEELQGSVSATTLRKAKGQVTVSDGPFVEAKETIGGFSVVEAADMSDAIALARTWPGHGVEVRPLHPGR